jgi:hypothetical protein
VRRHETRRKRQEGQIGCGSCFIVGGLAGTLVLYVLHTICYCTVAPARIIPPQSEFVMGMCITRPAPKSQQGVPRAEGPALQARLHQFPCPLICCPSGLFPSVNLGHQRGWHMKRWISSGPPFLTAAVGWQHVSHSAATPEWQAKDFEVLVKTNYKTMNGR